MIPKPRVLLVSHFYPSHRGGVEIVAGELASRLADDFRIRWAAGRDDEPNAAVGRVELVPFDVWNGIERRTGIPVPIPGPRALARLLREVRRAEVVWIHDLLYPSNLFVAIAARVSSRPLVVTVHVGPIPYKNRILRAVMKAAFRLTTRVLLPAATQVAFVSERVRDETVRIGPWPRPPLFIPNGFDPTIFHQPTTEERSVARAELDAESRPLLLFVGRFVERKGLELIRGLASRTPDWRWVLAGRGPVDPDSWAAENVTVVRGVSGSSLARLYGAADALVLPSLGEGFPLVVIESMACGTPAIVDPSTAAGDRTAAAWLDVESVAADDRLDGWQAHIERMITRPDRESRRQAISDFALEHWSWDRAADAYRSVLMDAAGKRTA